MKRAFAALLILSSALAAGDGGDRVTYVGGTVAGVKARTDARISLNASDALMFSPKNGASIEVPYRDITTLEYGQRVSRRYVEAVLISPVFLVAKRKTHYLTIGYSDRDGHQQAIVMQINKDEIRPLLVSLEARTGRRVEYQDEDARRSGKG